MTAMSTSSLRRAMVDRDVANRVAELLNEDGAVGETTVTRPEALRGGERRKLVAAHVHPRLDRSVQLQPGVEDLRSLRERTLEVLHRRRSLPAPCRVSPWQQNREAGNSERRHGRPHAHARALPS